VAPTIRDAALFLDIHMQQLPGPLALVAHHLPGRAVQITKARDLVADQHRMHRRVGLTQRPTNTVRTDSVSRPIGQDGLLTSRREPLGAGLGTGAAVMKAGRTLATPAPEPLVARRQRHALGFGGPGWRPALFTDPLNQQTTTMHGQLRPRMGHESLHAWNLNSPERGGSHLPNNLSGNYT
jgi:hypothetical protein